MSTSNKSNKASKANKAAAAADDFAADELNDIVGEVDVEAKIAAAQGAGKYLADESERHLYHVKVDKPVFSSKDGKKLSKAYIQKFSIGDFKNFKRHALSLGFTISVVWNPEAYADPEAYTD